MALLCQYVMVVLAKSCKPQHLFRYGNLVRLHTTRVVHDSVQEQGMACARMTFSWASNSTEILVPGWPGDAPGMYVLALAAVLVAAALLEWCIHGRLARLERGCGGGTSGLMRAAAHACRVCLGYVVMLAVMSFDVGVLAAAVLGHAVGFMAIGCDGYRPVEPWSREMKTELGSMGC